MLEGTKLEFQRKDKYYSIVSSYGTPPYLVVDDIRVGRGVQGINGVKDVMCQVGQVNYGIGNHCFRAGCAGQQERN